MHTGEWKHILTEGVFDCWLDVCLWMETCEVWLRRFHKKIHKQKDGKLTMNVVFWGVWTRYCHCNEMEFWWVLACRCSRQCIVIAMEEFYRALVCPVRRLCVTECVDSNSRMSGCALLSVLVATESAKKKKKMKVFISKREIVSVASSFRVQLRGLREKWAARYYSV